MFMSRNGKISEVGIISVENGLCKVYDRDEDEVVENVSMANIGKSYREAELSQKEYEIKKDFKKRNRGKKGLLTCEWCGRKGKDLTLDHIVSLDSFGGRKNIRANEDIWEKAWSFKNLQILCEECNQRKDKFINRDGNMSFDDIDYHARILNNKKVLKKNQHKDSPANKIGYGIATGKWATNRTQMSEYVAKADSNILRLDMIFSGKEAYDLLPKTI